ncbi:anaerobic C4-dicarboxylate transporter [Yersinia enterocolitica subsp. enterocolitica]|nr:anaerobic C4-dicarboxylate transporter [Yersinia enterocolitica subsp. enterocolitica]
MIAVELVIVLLAIFLGARLGGIGIGFAGGIGVLVLAIIGVKPGSIPFDVISIIMAVIAAISAMQVAGGMDYLVQQTEKLLRKNPKHITILAPLVTYFLTIFAGTGNISLSALPVIAEVAKEQGIKPCRPLSTAVVSAQIAITASPISFCGSGLHVFRHGRSWRQLLTFTDDSHPIHPACGICDVSDRFLVL